MKVKIKSQLSKRKLKNRVKRKTNSELAETIEIAFANEKWKPVAKMLSGATKQYASIDLAEIDRETKTGDTIVILGKVLASGDLTKKVRICALGISESAKEKLKKTKSEYASIMDEIKINKKGEGVKIIK